MVSAIIAWLGLFWSGMMTVFQVFDAVFS